MIFILARDRHEAQAIAEREELDSRHWQTLNNEYALRNHMGATVLQLSCVTIDGRIMEAIRAAEASVIHFRCWRH